MDHRQFRSLVLSAVLLGGGFALDFAAHAADQAVLPVSEKKDGTLYSVDLAKYADSAQTRLEKDPETIWSHEACFYHHWNLKNLLVFSFSHLISTDFVKNRNCFL